MIQTYSSRYYILLLKHKLIDTKLLCSQVKFYPISYLDELPSRDCTILE